MNKTHTGTRTGPITLDVRLAAGQIRVIAEDRTNTEVTVSTPDSSGPSAEAVTNTAITETGGHLEVRGPNPGGTGGAMIQTSGGGVVVGSNYGVIVGGNVYGSVMSGVTGGEMWVNGKRVTGGVVVGGSPIDVEVRVPYGSTVAAKTASADVTVTGEVNSIDAETMSGDVYASSAREAYVGTMSGDVEIAALSVEARIKTMSGDIEVTGVPFSEIPVPVRASSMSGDITVRGRVDLDGRSMSGRVRNR